MRLTFFLLIAAATGGCAKNHPPAAHAEAVAHERTASEAHPHEGNLDTDAAPRRSARGEIASADERIPSDVQETNGNADADSTAQNKADRSGDTLTPLDQGESAGDRETTQGIRKAVVGDDSLSFTAKNVKIITRDGRVTLRGPVNSTKERDAIGEIARRVAGGTQVDNQLQVTTN
jgi:hyperosmotically inducible protein